MCKETLIMEEKYRGYVIKIYQDVNGPNPRRDFDNFGTMVCFHPNYNLGNKHDFSREDLVEYVKRKDVLSLPLYLLDHSGLWLRTSRYACDPNGWDTSFIGYIVVDYAKIRKEFGKCITKKVREHVYMLLKGEVKEYSAYLEGDVFGYVIEDPTGNEVDSCWGFIGWDLSGEKMLSECRSVIDHHIENEAINTALAHEIEIGDCAQIGCSI